MKDDLKEQYNTCEMEKRHINQRLEALDKRLIKFTQKELRAAKNMRIFAAYATLFTIVSVLLFIPTSIIYEMLAVANLTMGVITLGAAIYQIYAYKIFRRFNVHSQKLYDQYINKKNIIISNQKDLLSRIEMLEKKVPSFLSQDTEEITYASNNSQEELSL